MTHDHEQDRREHALFDKAMDLSKQEVADKLDSEDIYAEDLLHAEGMRRFDAEQRAAIERAQADPPDPPEM